MAYINGAELIIHNAAFDLGFLDYELSRLGSQYGKITDRASVLDTLVMARERYPGQRNSLDALCKRLGVDNAHRQLHGALLDAQILADVYIALTCGQEEIGFALPESSCGGVDAASVAFMPDVLLTRPCVVVSQSELEAMRRVWPSCVRSLVMCCGMRYRFGFLSLLVEIGGICLGTGSSR